MAQYGEQVHHSGQFAQQQHHPHYPQHQQYPQTQYYQQVQSQSYSQYSQNPQSTTNYQYPQPSQQHQPQPSHQYPQDYANQYPQQYQYQPQTAHQYPPQQYPPQHQQPYPQQYPQQYAQQHSHVNGYNYGQNQAAVHHPSQYQGVDPNTYHPPNGHSAQTCFNCGRSDHFVQNCPEPRRDSQAGHRKANRYSSHQPQQAASNSGNPTLSRSSSFTQQSAPYGQISQMLSPHPQTPQTPYSAPTPQWQGSPQQYNPQAQNYEAHWQSQRYSPNASLNPQPYNQPSDSSATSRDGPQFQPPPQPKVFQEHSQVHSSSTDASTETLPHLQTSDTTGGLSTSDIDPEDLEDDLSKLDVPDIPALQPQHVDGVLKLVSQVLPSNFIVADALYPLAIPPPEAEGRCQSRFFFNKSEEESLQDFRTSPLWRDRQEDTMFSIVESNGSIMSLDACLSKVKERRKPRSEQNTWQARQPSQPAPPRSAEAIEMAEALAKVEQALADAKAKEAEMLARKRIARAQQTKSNGKSESPAKRKVSSTSETQSQPANKSSQSGTNEHSNPQASRRYSQHTYDRTSPVEKTQSNHLPRDFSVQNSNSRAWNERNGNNIKQNGRNPESAPRTVPKPVESNPQGRHHGNPDLDRRSSFESRKFQPHTERGPPSGGHDANSSRKRNFDSRAESSSDEDDDSPRRQENDVTPRHEKRRPKVSDVYSRRW